MERFRITTTRSDEAEQTWVLLPDVESATMQAEELWQREKVVHVRIYRERTGEPQELIRDLPPKAAPKPK